MKPIFFVALLLVIAAALAPTVVAQPDNSTVEIEVNDSDDTECTEHIDQNTRLCSAEFDDGTAILEVESDRPQSVTLTDAGAFIAGGQVPQETYRLQEGLNTLRFGATQRDGFAGVSIDTGSSLYAVPLEDSSPVIGGPWTAEDAQTAAIAGASSVSLMTLWLTLSALLGRSNEPERIA